MQLNNVADDEPELHYEAIDILHEKHPRYRRIRSYKGVFQSILAHLKDLTNLLMSTFFLDEGGRGYAPERQNDSFSRVIYWLTPSISFSIPYLFFFSKSNDDLL